MSTWIDFKELRQRLNFLDVIAHYKIEVKVKGERATGLCPLRNHPARTDGEKRTASFSANVPKGIWQCFGCRASGNVLELAARMEGFNPSDPVELRKAALKVADVFRIGMAQPPKEGLSERQKPDASPSVVTPKSEASSALPQSNEPSQPASQLARLKTIINEPLNFELKHLDLQHPYLASRGIRPETVEHFGLGFCAKGIMADRIAIPLHDLKGKLVGYAGRAIDDHNLSDENPKYRFLGPRERQGIRYEFRKSHLLYNAHRLRKPVMDLIVVEGFLSVWWLWQAQYQNVVALMGSSCSEEQAEEIVEIVDRNGHVWALPDGDTAGTQCAASLLTQISPHRFLRWVKLGEGAQPTDCSELNLSFILDGLRTPGRNLAT